MAPVAAANGRLVSDGASGEAGCVRIGAAGNTERSAALPRGEGPAGTPSVGRTRGVASAGRGAGADCACSASRRAWIWALARRLRSCNRSTRVISESSRGSALTAGTAGEAGWKAPSDGSARGLAGRPSTSRRATGSWMVASGAAGAGSTSASGSWRARADMDGLADGGRDASASAGRRRTTVAAGRRDGVTAGGTVLATCERVISGAGVLWSPATGGRATPASTGLGRSITGSIGALATIGPDAAGTGACEAKAGASIEDGMVRGGDATSASAAGGGAGVLWSARAGAGRSAVSDNCAGAGTAVGGDPAWAWAEIPAAAGSLTSGNSGGADRCDGWSLPISSTETARRTTWPTGGRGGAAGRAARVPHPPGAKDGPSVAAWGGRAGDSAPVADDAGLWAVSCLLRARVSLA